MNSQPGEWITIWNKKNIGFEIVQINEERAINKIYHEKNIIHNSHNVCT